MGSLAAYAGLWGRCWRKHPPLILRYCTENTHHTLSFPFLTLLPLSPPLCLVLTFMSLLLMPWCSQQIISTSLPLMPKCPQEKRFRFFLLIHLPFNNINTFSHSHCLHIQYSPSPIYPSERLVISCHVLFSLYKTVMNSVLGIHSDLFLFFIPRSELSMKKEAIVTARLTPLAAHTTGQ